LAFFDIGPPTGGGLDVPDDLVNDYFMWAYMAGARIHTNSWGSATSEYTIFSYDVDDFMYQFKDMLILFAAGNDGSCGSEPFTVGSPSTAKNSITVGASQTTASQWQLRPSTEYTTYGPTNYNENSMASFSSAGHR